MRQGSSGSGRSVTLEEVARVAGVSRATASRVVNGSPKVNPQARRGVERAIARLGYVPNRAARSLVTRRSDSIGVVIREPTARLFGDPYFPQLLSGISAALSPRGLQLILLMPRSREEDRRLEQYLTAGHIDGVLLASLHGNDPLPGRLDGDGIPVVVGGRPPEGVRVSFVDNDNYGGAVAAVSHLIASGRHTVATISGPLDMEAGVARLRGYREALRSAGRSLDPSLEAEGEFTQESGAQAMRALLQRHPELDAVFVASDLMAAGALQVLNAAERRVPDDVAIVGFDDSPIALMTVPPLSTVRQSIEEMGREMVRLLLESIDERDRAPRQVILVTELILRGSCGGGPMS